MSNFHKLRPASRGVYLHYLGQIEKEIGSRTVGDVSGLDLKEWHVRWSSDGRHLAASNMCRAVLLAVVAFGVEARLAGCAELAVSLRAANRNLPNPKRRESVITAEQVVALRAAAHADKRPSSALAYALVYETTMRLWDVILGMQWEDIDANLVMRHVPSKTSTKTGLAITYPLTRAPMVVEELVFAGAIRLEQANGIDRYVLADRPVGPMVVCEGTGRPYLASSFREQWRKDRNAAGVPANVWARDLRASGITEGRASGVSTDDAAKVAGHASTKTTAAVYDRATLEAAERFADARAAYRKLKAAK
ncbi:tyrosine-type recombinase/integrase [Mesorhizobium sp. B2-5-7]|uniref:tyrosine-type recombinase/integrase n=1 Tax=Mesorhizobium sp. B2-5-7 TaxID=2589923 RepID=UPI0015E291F7|nr:tyrosine-type recombinase/integrase [Mesorhizobium sp. B2-5-7]